MSTSSSSSSPVFPLPSASPLQVRKFLEACERGSHSDDILTGLSLETEFNTAQLKEGLALCSRRQWIACRTTAGQAAVGTAVLLVADIPESPSVIAFWLFLYLALFRGLPTHWDVYRTRQTLLSLLHVQAAGKRLDTLSTPSDEKRS
jgi:hypothetical protein